MVGFLTPTQEAETKGTPRNGHAVLPGNYIHRDGEM
jgi:hypothetical protein